jgi:uncharacterized membrane protein YjfL (UPF0719 family)
MSLTLDGPAGSLLYVGLGLAVLLIAKLLKDLLTPYKLDEELTARDNPAMGLTLAGYYLGVIIIYLGATVGPLPEGELSRGELLVLLLIDLAYSVGGILLLNLGRMLLDRVVLTGFSTVKEIIEDRNVGMGAVEMGSYLATAFTVAGAIHGLGGGPLTALVFFALGQVVLLLFARFYQLITRYDVHHEIEQDNVAAGVALGLSLVAIGIVLLKATSGAFVGWGENLWTFAWEAGLGFLLLMVLRWITDWVFLPGTTIAHEIARDRNLNAAWIEGAVAMGMASVIFFML